MEDEGVDLAAQGIEAETAGPVDEEREFVVGRVARDRAPDEGEVARVVECGEARDGDKLGAGDDRASNSADEGDAAIRGGDAGDQWMEGLDCGERPAAFLRVQNGLGLLEGFRGRGSPW